MDNPFTEMNRACVINGVLGLQPGMKVVDSGCGPGRLSILAAQAIVHWANTIATALNSDLGLPLISVDRIQPE